MSLIYPKESLDVFPKHLSPGYRSTVKRSPSKPLIIVPHTLSELTGPVYGHDAVQEGERTLLDNSMILFMSSMMTGNHNNDQLPVVMLGRAGGQIKTGRVLDYLGKPNRKMCSLYLSLMDKMGVHLDSFGDSKERLNAP